MKLHFLRKMKINRLLCGPERFGVSLKETLVKAGLPEASFHKEIFRMR